MTPLAGTSTEATIVMLRVDDIEMGPGRRPVQQDAADRLAQSMSDIGLRTPITVRNVQGRIVLVAGAHRLAAAKKLGWSEIACYSAASMTDDDARLWEISENLHRSELTALERDELFAEYVRLGDARAKTAGATCTSSLPDGRKKGPQHMPSGINAAARELGIEGTAAKRAIKVASLSPEAKEAARELGLDDNRSALLKAASAAPDKQAEAIRDIAVRKAAPEPTKTTLPETYVRPEPPESIYDDLPVENSFDEAARRLKVWERSHREAWDDAQGKAARAAAPIVPSTSAPGQRYGVIYADMNNLAGIKATDINAIAEADAMLFLWAPATALPAALEAVASAGFTYCDQFVWGKPNAASGKINRNKHELLLVGTRGKIPAPARDARAESLIYGQPDGEDWKPPIVRRIIETAYPSLTRVELNANSKIDGWATLAGARGALEVDDDNPFSVAAE